ncbi:hypothetical protein Ciccas_009462, partial [Cichlidogyrus casuarinus]
YCLKSNYFGISKLQERLNNFLEIYKTETSDRKLCSILISTALCCMQNSEIDRIYFEENLAALDSDQLSNLLRLFYEKLTNPTNDSVIQAYFQKLIKFVTQVSSADFRDVLISHHLLTLFAYWIKNIACLNPTLLVRIKSHLFRKILKETSSTIFLETLKSLYCTLKLLYLKRSIACREPEEIINNAIKDLVRDPNFEEEEIRDRFILIMAREERISETFEHLDLANPAYCRGLLYYKVLVGGEIVSLLFDTEGQLVAWRLLDKLLADEVYQILNRCSVACFNNEHDRRDYLLYSDARNIPDASCLPARITKLLDFVAPAADRNEQAEKTDQDVSSILKRMYALLIRPMELACGKEIHEIGQANGVLKIRVDSRYHLTNCDPFNELIPWGFLQNWKGDSLKDRCNLVHLATQLTTREHLSDDADYERFLACGAPVLYKE